MNLLLLTKAFPFGTGEAFIENEIKEVATKYEKIIIVACEVPDEEKYIREVPDNVIYYRVPVSNKNQKIVDLIQGLIFIHKFDDDFKKEFRNNQRLIEKLFLIYFEQKSRRIYKYIKEKGITNELNSENYILYSYWLFTTARVGLLISEQKNFIYKFSRAHGYDLYEYRHKIKYLPYRELFLTRYDNIFPCSKNGMEHLSSKLNEYSKKIKTLYLGTNDNGIGKNSKDGIFRIVSCSRVSPEKRIGRIIDSLEVIDSKGYNIEWIHIGSGKMIDNLIKDSKNKLQNIKFKFLGSLTNNEVINYYKNNPVDLFLNVSSTEGLPVSIMEAISFGIPIIATDVGGTSEIVINNVTGKLLRKNFRDSELADEIEAMINYNLNRNYSEIRNKCRCFWEQNFQAKLNYNFLCKYINEQIESKNLKGTIK